MSRTRAVPSGRRLRTAAAGAGGGPPPSAARGPRTESPGAAGPARRRPGRAGLEAEVDRPVPLPPPPQQQPRYTGPCGHTDG